MDMIKKYIYAVTKRLPEKQREDIEKELLGLIEDMLDERTKGAEASEKDIEAVLKELGDPSTLADKYRGSKRYLIGPEYFEQYITVLKIVLAATAFGLFVALTVSYIVAPPTSVTEVFSNVVGSIIQALFQAFTWVTIIFAVIEFNQVKFNRAEKKEFEPSKLPDIPDKQFRIKRSGPIVSIIFSIIFLTILNFYPQLFGVAVAGSGIIPIFNIDVLSAYLLLINISFACVILKQILMIVYAKYTFSMTAASIVLSLASLLISIIVISDINIWNPNFVSELFKNATAKSPAGFDFVNTMSYVSKIIIGLGIFGFIVETVTNVVKTVKYERKNRAI